MVIQPLWAWWFHGNWPLKSGMRWELPFVILLRFAIENGQVEMHSKFSHKKRKVSTNILGLNNLVHSLGPELGGFRVGDFYSKIGIEPPAGDIADWTDFSWEIVPEWAVFPDVQRIPLFVALKKFWSSISVIVALSAIHLLHMGNRLQNRSHLYIYGN